MLSRFQKEELVKKLSEEIKAGKVAIFSDYTGTSVAKMQVLRRELRKSNSIFKITKKKLMQLAFEKAGLRVDVKNMTGQIGVAIGKEDEVSAAKVLSQFSRENDNFKIIEGILGEKMISSQEITALAALPSKEELLSKLISSINASARGFVNVLAGNIRGLVTVLRGIADSKT